MNLSDVIIAPLLTEKSSAALALQKITFRVHPQATKTLVKQAVQLKLGAKVKAVHMLTVAGKSRRLGRFEGKKPDWKKAVVTLREGEKIAAMEGLLS